MRKGNLKGNEALIGVIFLIVIALIVGKGQLPLASFVASCSPSNAGGFGTGFCLNSPATITLSANQNLTNPFFSASLGSQAGADQSSVIISNLGTHVPGPSGCTQQSQNSQQGCQAVSYSYIYMKVVNSTQPTLYFNLTIANITYNTKGNAYPNGAGIKYVLQAIKSYTPNFGSNIYPPQASTSTVTTSTTTSIVTGGGNVIVQGNYCTSSCGNPIGWLLNPIIAFFNSLGLNIGYVT